MPKKTAQTAPDLLAVSEEFVSAFSTELKLFEKLRDDFLLHKELIKQPELDEVFNEGLWEKVKIELNENIGSLERNITYLNSQLAILRKAQAVFATDDPAAIKAAVVDYLRSDVNLSLKNLALVRFDFTDAKNMIDEIIGLGKKE